MTLREYLRDHLGIGGFLPRGDRPGSMHLIGQFEFGDLYCVMMLSGARIEIKELDTILSILYDELKLADTWDINLTVHGRAKMLIAKPKNELGRPWGRNCSQIVNQIRMAITEYNLSERWPESIPQQVRLPAFKGW